MQPEIASAYLLGLGQLFWYYMLSIWIFTSVTVVTVVVIGYQVYTTTFA